MAMLLSILAIPFALGQFVCWIMTIIKAFQKEEGPLMGILSICGCIGFILGWVNADKWEHKQIMLVWTGCLAVGIIIYVLQIVVIASS